MNKSKFFLFSFLAVFALGSFSLRPKGNLEQLTEKIISLLTAYVEEMPEEKVYLHLDKAYYAAGDDIWFSAYLTAGSPDVLSPLSKVVYVDLLDNEGNLLAQKTVRMEEGQGAGDFKLDGFLKEGIYHIKAYSTWSKGFGEGQVFSQSIEVMDPLNMDFQPYVDFEWQTNEQQADYTGNIRVVNRNLQPLANQTLKYALVSRDKVFEEGNLTLDGEGRADYKASLPLTALTKPAFLRLVMEENEEFSISRQYKLPFPEQLIDIQFLPEGGEMVDGFANKVAFRAVYPDGSPAKVKGEITADGFAESFESNDNGLGAISFTPESSKKYTAFLMRSDGEKHQLDFPKVQPKGVNLMVDSRNPQLLNLLIQAKDYASFDPGLEGLLVVHARGRIGYMQKLNLQAGVTGARVNKNQLATGINQVTIFNSEGKPLAERLVYVDFEQTPKIDIQTQSTDFSGRGKNKIKLHMDAEVFEGGKYSVSITDAGNPYGSAESNNIITYLKFASELNGRISDKDLFEDGSLNAEAVDLIMLTHGWRRFNWDQVFEQSFQNPAHIELGINIMGTVAPKHKSKKGLDGGTLNIFSRGAEEDFYVAEFTENGRFILDGLDFNDTTTLVLNAEDKRQKKMLDITVDEPASKYAQWSGFEPLLKTQIINPAFKEYLETAEKRRQSQMAFTDPDLLDMDEFVVTHKRTAEEKDGITRLFGEGDKVLKVADIPGSESYGNIFEMMMGRLPGVRIKPDLMNPQVTIRGVNSVSGVQPIFLLDNVQVEIDIINMVNPRDVDTIEAFTDGASNAIFGAAGAGGVIAVYTKPGGSRYSPEEGVLHAKYPGYSTAREFYMPKYDEEKSSKPDFRSTLYWNPLVKWTGKEAEIDFFNNDVSGKFRVVVQGIDQFGRLSYAEKIIE